MRWIVLACVNVILPEQRSYFMLHLGYFLATLLLLAFIVVGVIVLTRRRKKRGFVCGCVCVWTLLVLYNHRWHVQYSCYSYVLHFLLQGWITICVDLNSKTLSYYKWCIIFLRIKSNFKKKNKPFPSVQRKCDPWRRNVCRLHRAEGLQPRASEFR